MENVNECFGALLKTIYENAYKQWIKNQKIWLFQRIIIYFKMFKECLATLSKLNIEFIFYDLGKNWL